MTDLQVSYFLSVAETGNLTKTAKLNFVSPPAVSRQILALEQELGFPLFERLRSGVRLLPAGERVREAILLNQQSFAELIRSLREAQNVEPPRILRLGQATDWHFFQQLYALREYLASLPQSVHLTISIGDPDDLAHALADGMLDVALIPSNATNAVFNWPFSHQTIYFDQRVALFSSRWPLAALHPSELSALAPYPLLVSNGSDNELMLQMNERACAAYGFRPKIELVSSHDSMLFSVGTGIGWCLASKRCWAMSSPDFAHIPLDEPGHLTAYWREGHNDAILSAVAFLEQAFDTLSQSQA